MFTFVQVTASNNNDSHFIGNIPNEKNHPKALRTTTFIMSFELSPYWAKQLKAAHE